MKSQTHDPASIKDVAPSAPRRTGLRAYLLLGAAGLLVWWLVYASLAPFAAWFTYSLRR